MEGGTENNNQQEAIPREKETETSDHTTADACHEDNSDEGKQENNAETEEEGMRNDVVAVEQMSKSARKKLSKMQRYEAKKAQRKQMAKQKKKEELERKRKEWSDKLSEATEEEKSALVQSKLNARHERMSQHLQQREQMKQKLSAAMRSGQNIVIDLEFSHLMTHSEITSLSQQIMYCYAGNRKSPTPSHLWITGCQGEIQNRLNRVPGFSNWLIEKEERSYIEVFHEQREDLVYLTADSEDVLEEMEASKIYIIGGLVDRNRWKGITMKKATEQAIKTAKLPIADYLKMTSSQVLTVNQVFEILLSYLEWRDWKKSFFQVIPQRKRSEEDSSSEPNESKKVRLYEDESVDDTPVPGHVNPGSSLCEGSAHE